MSEYFLPPSTATAVRRHARTLGGLKREKGGIKWSDTGGSGVTADGWINDTAETWTYASAGSFTVPGNLTAKYSVGTYIKLTQTTLKFFVVSSSSYAAGTTTVNITAGTDYTLANAAITANFHSYVVAPQGWPGYFNFAPAWTGFSVNPVVDFCRFGVVGRTCYFEVNIATNGTSNATTLTFTIPIARSLGSTSPPDGWQPAIGKDNGSFTASPALVGFTAGSTTATAYKDYSLAPWTASGFKYVEGRFSYEI